MRRPPAAQTPRAKSDAPPGPGHQAGRPDLGISLAEQIDFYRGIDRHEIV